MRKVTVVCDCCEKPIPTFTKKDVFGIEHVCLDKGEILILGEPYPMPSYVDLCKECALKISLGLSNFKAQTLLEAQRK